MWTVLEARIVQKAIAKAPRHIVERYEVWKAIVRNSGPNGFQAIKGLHDEALAGEWDGFRSSRLNLQWRVIYEVDDTAVSVHVVRISAHDYRH